MIGKTIGRYRIEAEIGRGGMGVVYRAEDTKLKRPVALKFLPQDLTRSEEARDRFTHEAQAASALDHPNICTIYEIDETDEGQVFMAMALYEGTTLREKIAERPLRLEEAADIAAQIALGLARAHESKIIHRDVKPANVFLTAEGQVKILDFGLAKLAGQTKLTMTGSTLGTVSYMAPEQARGEEADHRADIWALGVVMYEMLTGLLPFRGEHEQAVIYALLNSEPEPITALRTGVPIDLEWIVQKALRKDPRERYQHVDEIPIDLRTVMERRLEVSRVSSLSTVSARSIQTAPAAAPPANSLRPRMAIPLGALLLAVGLVVGRLLAPAPPDQALPVTRLDLPLPDLTFSGGGSQIAVSPGGRYIVFQMMSSGQDADPGRSLFIRAVDDTEIRPLPDTRNAVYPFFSPDGSQVGFIDESNHSLKRHYLESGRTLTIKAFQGFPGAGTWGPDDTIVLSLPGVGLIRVQAAGGISDTLAIRDTPGERVDYRWPQFLPDGENVLVTRWREGDSYDSAQAAVISLGTGEVQTLIPIGVTFPRYLPALRSLLYIRDRTLTVAPFDPVRLEITGPEIATRERIEVGSGGPGRYGLSETGLLVAKRETGSGAASLESLQWVDRQGNGTPLGIEPRDLNYPLDLSPDGTQIAVAVRRSQLDASTDDIWVFGTDGSNPTRLTFEGDNRRPVWSPDGKRVAFGSNNGDGWDIHVKAADGTGEVGVLVSTELNEFPISWSSNGNTLAYYAHVGGGQRDLWLLQEDGESVPFVDSPNDERTPVFSPDGAWIAYASNESGVYEIYVQPRPGSAMTGKWSVSEGGGTEPVWAPDGGSLYFLNGSRLMQVEVTFSPTFRPGVPREVFNAPQYRHYSFFGTYDIHPDGSRFVMMVPLGREATPDVYLVQHWFEELKRLLRER